MDFDQMLDAWPRGLTDWDRLPVPRRTGLVAAAEAYPLGTVENPVRVGGPVEVHEDAAARQPKRFSPLAGTMRPAVRPSNV